MFNLLNQNGERSVFNIQWKHWILFLLILGLGTFSRLWDFNRLPPGLNPDEASIGVDAFNLYHYGLDRNGVSFPVDFISWGSGQNALYGYLLIPFIAFWGLSPAVVRLPMLICGILTLPLMFWVGRKTFDIRFGLLSMFFLAICPWHILLSRWGLESNIFPFIFMLGYAFILCAEESPGCYVVACLFFGLSLYCYGTAYVMVPTFLICITIIFLRTKTFSFKELIPGLIVFAIISTPIILFIFINYFGINSIKLAVFTIPRLPVSAQFETETVIYNSNPIQGIFQNGLSITRLLLFQTDGIIYNFVDPFRYFYKIAFPLSILGIVLLFLRSKKRGYPKKQIFLLCWPGASFLIGFIQTVNINRINIIFIPILMSIAFDLIWLNSINKNVLSTSILLFIIGFVLFTIRYHGETYRQQIEVKFQAGLLSALNFSGQFNNSKICVTDKINMPYIYALITEQGNPENFINTVKYVNSETPLRQVASYGRYIFGKDNCSGAGPIVHLLRINENPPRIGDRYKYKFFDDFVVYYPKP